MSKIWKMKPHHFMDIMKLHGAGIDHFVPDEAYKHDFYLVGNEILNNRDMKLQTTIDEDRICKPCIHIGKDGLCQDSIGHIESITSKDAWNKMIDKRIIQYADISLDKIYTALDYCKLLYGIREHIKDIWKEEENQAIKTRYMNFCKGVEKYLNI